MKKSTLNTFVFFTLAALYYTSLQSAFIPFLVLVLAQERFADGALSGPAPCLRD